MRWKTNLDGMTSGAVCHRGTQKLLAFVVLLCATPVAAAVIYGADHPAADGRLDITHRMMLLMLQLGTILFAARVGNLAFVRLRMPPVLGELCAGMLIGPFVLGALPLPGLPHGLFGESAAEGALLTVSPELYGVSTLAAVVLLFMVGLETDLKRFLRYSLAGSLSGVGGVLLSFVAGTGLTSALSPVLLGEVVGWMAPPCLMVGVIFTATSVGVSSRILAERRQLDTPEGVTILAGAVIDDILGVVLLAIVMGVATFMPTEGAAFPWRDIVRIALKTTLFWLVATALGLLAARRISAGLKHFGERTVIAVMALGLALIVAGLFESMGLAMIVGAYITGLSLSRTDVRHVILERLRGLDVMLVPVFFAVMGMLVDVRQLLHPATLGYGLLFFMFALLAKVLGCGVPTLLAGFTVRGGFRIGSGMIPRGEVTLLMAGAGVAAGLLSPSLLGIVIVMTLFSALAAPPMMLLAFRGTAPGLRRPPPPDDEQELSFPFPSVAVTQLLTDKLVACFEREGFYVHLLDRGQRLYQLRKDAVIIGFRRTDTAIIFSCPARDIAFVQTAMNEVVAELEQTVRELRKPLDTESLRQVNKEGGLSGASSAPSHLFYDMIQPALLCPALQAESRDAAIAELLDRIASTGILRHREAVYAGILEREHSLSTGLQDGVAVPHVRTDNVDKLVCAVGLKPDGLDFSAADGQPTRIIVLTLAPAQAVGPYLQFISMISMVLNAEGRHALLQCNTPEEMYAVLTNRNAAPGGLLRGLRKRFAAVRSAGNPVPEAEGETT